MDSVSKTMEYADKVKEKNRKKAIGVSMTNKILSNQPHLSDDERRFMALHNNKTPDEFVKSKQPMPTLDKQPKPTLGKQPVMTNAQAVPTTKQQSPVSAALSPVQGSTNKFSDGSSFQLTDSAANAKFRHEFGQHGSFNVMPADSALFKRKQEPAQQEPAQQEPDERAALIQKGIDLLDQYGKDSKSAREAARGYFDAAGKIPLKKDGISALDQARLAKLQREAKPTELDQLKAKKMKQDLKEKPDKKVPKTLSNWDAARLEVALSSQYPDDESRKEATHRVDGAAAQNFVFGKFGADGSAIWKSIAGNPSIVGNEREILGKVKTIEELKHLIKAITGDAEDA